MADRQPRVTPRIRPIAPSDRDALVRFYANLSTDALEARFHGAMPGIGDGTARYFCGPDHEHREGLVAETTDTDGRSVIVGHLCLEPAGPRDVEVAIAIADSWQHHGLGRAMLSRAVVWAQARGVVELHASIRCSNGAMFGLIHSVGLSITLDHGEGGVVDATIGLGAPLRQAA